MVRTVLVIVALVGLVGCGSPMDKVPTLAEVDLPEDAEAVSAVEIPAPAETESQGLFARLLNRQSPLEAPDVPDATEQPSGDVVAEAPAEGAEVVEGAEVATQATIAPLAPTETDNAPKKKGLFAFLTKDAEPEETKVIAASLPVDATAAAEVQAEAQMLAATPAIVEEAEEEAEKDTTRKGLFAKRDSSAKQDTRDRSSKSGGLFGPRKSKAVSEVEYGTTLPYGDVKRICGLTKSQLGKRVSQFPEKRGQYEIYDSSPGNTAPHTFYLTGFDDGCARQFTAALAMFGSVGMHEQLRYGLPSKVQPYSRTDEAYEDLKSKVCRVPRQKPCGDKVKKIEKDTVFVSIYERFGGNARWSNLLLHDGDVIAQDSKGG